MFDFNDLIAIVSDHAGFHLKEFIQQELISAGYKFRDFGTYSEDSVDYPDFIHPLAKEINDGVIQGGIIICGSGNGAAMTANKYPGVRAALCWNEDIVKLSRQHNDANIIALPARFIDPVQALRFVQLFFTTGFEGGRHQKRVQKIATLR